jgi:hypothetical protein
MRFDNDAKQIVTSFVKALNEGSWKQGRDSRPKQTHTHEQDVYKSP